MFMMNYHMSIQMITECETCGHQIEKENDDELKNKTRREMGVETNKFLIDDRLRKKELGVYGIYQY